MIRAFEEWTQEELEEQAEMFRRPAWGAYARRLEAESFARVREAAAYAAVTGKGNEAAFASGQAALCERLLSWPDEVKKALAEKREEEEHNG